MAPRYDLIVVGGGVIGSAVAEALRHDLGRICLVERSPGRADSATIAAAGGINPHLGDGADEGVALLAQRSRDLYPEWVGRIAAEARVSLAPREVGLLQVAVDGDEYRRLTETVLPKLLDRGVKAVALDAAEALDREPLLSPGIAGALVQPDDLAIDPRALNEALDTVLGSDVGVEVRFGEVASVSARPGHAEVVLKDGTRLTAEKVVVAAGYQSRELLRGLLAPSVLQPVKGELLDLCTAGVLELNVLCDAVLNVGGEEHVVYASPYADGHVAVGVTFEEGTADTKCTDSARHQILTDLRRVLPALADLGAGTPIQRAGIRPATSDGPPLIGPVDDTGRLLVASGHQGLGITLAPRTAELLRVVVTGGTLTEQDERDLKFSDPRRFPRPA
ncbi:glycine oxidase ThiO [Actinocorallia aurea]